MKFKLTFPPELRKKIVDDLEISKKEAQEFPKGRKLRFFNWIATRVGMPLTVFVDYELLSDTELELTTLSSAEAFRKEAVISKVKKIAKDYGKDDNGNPLVKVDVLDG